MVAFIFIVRRLINFYIQVSNSLVPKPSEWRMCSWRREKWEYEDNYPKGAAPKSRLPQTMKIILYMQITLRYVKHSNTSYFIWLLQFCQGGWDNTWILHVSKLKLKGAELLPRFQKFINCNARTSIVLLKLPYKILLNAHPQSLALRILDPDSASKEPDLRQPS